MQRKYLKIYESDKHFLSSVSTEKNPSAILMTNSSNTQNFSFIVQKFRCLSDKCLSIFYGHIFIHKDS